MGNPGRNRAGKGREGKRRECVPRDGATAQGLASANAIECLARFQANDTRVSARVPMYRLELHPRLRRPPGAPHCQFGNPPAESRVTSSGSTHSPLLHPGLHGRRVSSSRPGRFPRSSGHAGWAAGARSFYIMRFALSFPPITSKTFQTTHAASTDRVAHAHVIT